MISEELEEIGRENIRVLSTSISTWLGTEGKLKDLREIMESKGFRCSVSMIGKGSNVETSIPEPTTHIIFGKDF